MTERCPVFIHEISCRQVISFSQPYPWHLPPIGSIAPCDSSHLPKVSALSEPFIVFVWETPNHSTDSMAAVTHGPLNLAIALRALFAWFRRSSGSSSPRCVLSVRENAECTDGTTPTHFLPALWSCSSCSPCQAESPLSPSNVLPVYSLSPVPCLSLFLDALASAPFPVHLFLLNPLRPVQSLLLVLGGFKLSSAKHPLHPLICFTRLYVPSSLARQGAPMS